MRVEEKTELENIRSGVVGDGRGRLGEGKGILGTIGNTPLVDKTSPRPLIFGSPKPKFAPRW